MQNYFLLIKVFLIEIKIDNDNPDYCGNDEVYKQFVGFKT